MDRRSLPASGIAALALLLALASPACRDEAARENDHVKHPTRPLSDVLAEQSPRLMAMPGVTAVGESALPDGTPCIKIYLRARDPELQRRLPRTIEGYAVVVDVSGEIRALPDSR
jgi:hypothetical protein